MLQIEQLEEHLEKSKEELSQLKSDLQENVELVSFSLSGHWVGICGDQFGSFTAFTNGTGFYIRGITVGVLHLLELKTFL